MLFRSGECLKVLCSIAYGQVEGSRDGGISDTRGSFDGSGSDERGKLDGSVASEATRNRPVATGRIAASELPMVRTVALASLKLVMTAVVLRVAVVSMTLLKL